MEYVHRISSSSKMFTSVEKLAALNDGSQTHGINSAANQMLSDVVNNR